MTMSMSEPTSRPGEFIAYGLLAGVHPFAGRATAQRLIAAHIAEQPRESSVVGADVPQRWSRSSWAASAEDGSGPVDTRASGAAYRIHGRWTPDGRWFVYRQNDRKTKKDVYAVSLDGPHTVRPLRRRRSRKPSLRYARPRSADVPNGGLLDAHICCNIYDMRRTTIFLPEQTLLQLQRTARRKHISTATLVREAVTRYLATPDPEAKVPSIAGQFASGARDTAERGDDLLWRDPHA